MSYEVIAGDELLGQFATGKGYHDLIEAAEGKGFKALDQLFADGETGQVRAVCAELRKLAESDVPADVRSTALGLAKMITGKTDIVITDGVIPGDDETEKEDTADLPDDVLPLGADGHALFRSVVKSYSGNGTPEMLILVKAYRALEDAGFEIRKDPTVGDVHVNKPLGEVKPVPPKRKKPSEIEKADVVAMDVPLLIRLLEVAREEIKEDVPLHQMAERLIELASNGKTLTMEDYDDVVSVLKASGTEEVPDAADAELRKALSEDDDLRKWFEEGGSDEDDEVDKYSPGQPRDSHGRFGTGGGGAAADVGGVGGGGGASTLGTGKDPFGVFRDGSTKAHIAERLGDLKAHPVGELKQICAEKGVKVGQVYTAVGDMRAKGYEIELAGGHVRVTNADPVTFKPISRGGPAPAPHVPAPVAPRSPFAPRQGAEGIAHAFSAGPSHRDQAQAVFAELRAKHPEIVALLERHPLNGVSFPEKFTFNGKKRDSVVAYYETYGGRIVMNGRPTRQQYPYSYYYSGTRVGVTHNVGFDNPSEIGRKTATFIHETGHHIEARVVNRSGEHNAQLSLAHANAKKTGNYVSGYARTNRAEYFAETFAAFHIQPHKLKLIDPQGHALISDVMARYKK